MLQIVGIVRPHAVRRTTEFNAWLSGLTDDLARRAIVQRLIRIEAGLFGDVRAVGGGVSEARVDVGQGYRAYYHRDGLEVTLLLCGGDTSTQEDDIKRAKAMVSELKKLKPKPKRKGKRR
jgi:putative addiction module killer protein